MAPKFGTSGLRGLVTELTDDLVADHVAAFLAACDPGTGLYVARDLRPSSPRIAAAVIAAVRAAGVDVTDCGEVPTPALALAAMTAGAGSVMVTGSHIPADRNGLKFYTPGGEVTKADEAEILSRLGAPRPAGGSVGGSGRLVADTGAGAACVARYVGAFGPEALRGRRIGVYSHSAVGRDLLLALFAGLGAEVTDLGRADHFIPVDTEAVDEGTRAQLRAWAASGAFDAIVSTDGDGDRPLLTDATGEVIPGDILGQITAAHLGADTVVTTVSANTGADLGGRFAKVIRARIGSPFVIAAMEAAGRADPAARITGYEPNGGFLLGFDAQVVTGKDSAGKDTAGELPRLMTRDAFLPLVAPLIAAGSGSLAARVAAEPARFTATDRLQEVPTERTQALVARLTADPAPLLSALDEAEAGRDLTDGLRLALVSGRVLHLRPSGNAPELRVYAESESPAAAGQLLRAGLGRVAGMISQG